MSIEKDAGLPSELSAEPVVTLMGLRLAFEVVVQTIEHGIYQTYDAAGANVHLANRLEQLAGAGTILISRETYDTAKQFVEVEPLGPQTIRGIAAPIEIFNLKGLKHAPSSGVFRSGRRLSPL